MILTFLVSWWKRIILGDSTTSGAVAVAANLTIVASSGPGYLTAQIPLLAPGEKRLPTFYHQHGDWFGWLCVGITGIMLITRLLRHRRTGGPAA